MTPAWRSCCAIWAYLGEVAADEYAVGLLGRQLRDLACKLRVTGLVLLLDHDLSAELLKEVHKGAAQANRIGRLLVGHNRDFLQLQLVEGELGHDRSLQRIRVADAEDVGTAVGQRGFGGADRHDRNPLRERGLLHLHRVSAGDLADDCDDTVRNQFLRRGSGRLVLGLRVSLKELDLLAGNSARLLEVGEGHLGAVDAVVAPGLLVTRLAGNDADLNRVAVHLGPIGRGDGPSGNRGAAVGFGRIRCTRGGPGCPGRVAATGSTSSCDSHAQHERRDSKFL